MKASDKPDRSLSWRGKLPYELEFYEDSNGYSPIREWLLSLDVRKQQVIGLAMNRELQFFGAGVCGTEFGKQLGRGLFEFRVRLEKGAVTYGGRKLKKAPPQPILLRVFCHAHGDKVVLLLAGYDKGKDPSPKRQDLEIKQARQLLGAWKRARGA